MLLYALLALFPVLSLAIPGTGCTSIGIITARASTELPGEGVIGSLAQLIQTRSRQTVSRANVDYPALLFPYGTSSAAGTAALKTQLTEAVRRCPDQGIVLLGYSQGAHVVGDVLGGGGGTGLGLKTPPVSTDVSKKVKAFVLMRDPRYRAEQSFNAGTAKRNGLFPREADQSLEGFASSGVSYCDTGDTFCDSGIDTVTHLAYTAKYNDKALQFVLDRIGG